jgi:indolepyruvate ferredoxin oxidoreductase, beta subunit
VYITTILACAAMKEGTPVATSEIHGLSQRGGSVNAGITFGENTFGFVEEGGADFLLGLELLESFRCLNYLNKNSRAVIDDVKIIPHHVNAQNASYPAVDTYIDFLQSNISEVDFVTGDIGVTDSILRNINVLGHACRMEGFPVQASFIESALRENAKTGWEDKIMQVFQKAMAKEKI